MVTSVVVVAHLAHRWLGECLESVADQCDETVLVDNGSAGGAVGAVGRAHGARVVALSRNAGFPAGVNAGVRASRGDVVALLNDDAMAGDSWLSSAAGALSDRTVAAVAPKLVFASPFAEVRFAEDEARRVAGDSRPLARAIRTATVAGVDVLDRLVGPGVHRIETGVLDGVEGPWRWTSGPEPIYVPVEDGWSAGDLLVNGEPAPVVGEARLVNNAGSYLSTEGHAGDHGYVTPDDGRFDAPAERFAACGAALVTTAAVLSQVGPFAAGFFAYYEDVDWCWRARLMGLRVLYEPAGVVRHVGGVTSGGPGQPAVKALAARNRLLCLARNAPLGVAARELRRALSGDLPEPAPGLPRSLARRLPNALAGRPSLARHRRRSPAEVWDRWAGVDQEW